MTDDEIVNDLDSMPFGGLMDPRYERPALVAPRKCRQHDWRSPDGDAPCGKCGIAWERHSSDLMGHAFRVPEQCARCGQRKDATAARRNRNNKKRGTSDEARVAAILGGRKVGPMGWPWDVEIEGYLRAQAKKLDAWPSINAIIALLDAIPADGSYLRAVTLADTPGQGGRTRRLIVLDLEEFAKWHGRAK